MIDKPKWTPNAESESIRNWTENLHKKAKRLLTQDGTHASLLFLFNKESGLISVNPVPPNVDHDQLNVAVENVVNEHDLYGVVFIGEIWAYFIKEKDHTAFQLLDGEMKVSDLNSEDKREALMVRMENSDGDCLVYLDEIIRDQNGVNLKDSLVTGSSQKMWFIHQ
jgi:hypothetical protein